MRDSIKIEWWRDPVWQFVGVVVAIAGVLATLYAAGKLPFAGAHSDQSQSVTTPKAVPPSSSGSNIPTSSPFGGGASTMESPGIRNKGSINLTVTGVFLDSTARNWDVDKANNVYADIWTDPYGIPDLVFNIPEYKLSSTDPSTYSTCADATGYRPRQVSVPLNELQKGDQFCVLTSGGRYSLLRIDVVGSDFVQLYAITWEKGNATS